MQRVLIANRGEIALRILRTLRVMGLDPIAVFSEADRTAPHVRLADTAVSLGDSEVGASYLSVESLLRAAHRSKADAIIPGYGFLSENADFADACTQAGLTFIGPPSAAIRSMGSKIEARTVAANVGVPLVPGGPAGDVDEAYATAARIGYPLLLKASAGGGGKGMRHVASAAELGPAFERAQSEALRAFGSSRVYLERFISPCRHIEVQVLGDQHGHITTLGERECSVQRRHQKVIEESPAPNLSDDTRQALLAAATALARGVDYHSVGTVEFLVDEFENFYFLEMNTRLQVEHTVTELVTGVDLVEAMIRVATGETLASVGLPSPRGCAIQARLYAENPAMDYQPSVGRITCFRPPQGPGLRLDHWVESGSEVTRFYDPLLGKLCAHGNTREVARKRLRAGLEELVITGIGTNLEQLKAVLDCSSFKAGAYHTGLLDDLRGEGAANSQVGPASLTELVAVAATLFANGQQKPKAEATSVESEWVRQHRLRSLR